MGYDVFAHKQTYYASIMNYYFRFIQTVHTVETMNFRKKVFGQLVMLGFDIAVFTPASYQRHRL